MNEKLKSTRLWTALVTPLKSDLTLDFVSLEKILREQEAAGNGILLLGSTGESLNMSERMKRDILDFSCGLELKSPLMVGVGGIGLQETKAWVQELSKWPIDALLMVSPLYTKPGDLGQYNWFKALLDSTDLPTMLYNVPGRTGGPLSFAAFSKLVGHRNLWALKEASGSSESFKRFVDLAKGKVKILSGDDAFLPSFCKLGASGLVSVASNSWPEATALYVKNALAGDLSDQDIKTWQKCSETLFMASNPIPVKAVMLDNKQILSGWVLAPLDHRDLESYGPVLMANLKIQEWHKSKEG